MDRRDLELLAVADALTQRRLRVPATDAWEAVHGHQPKDQEWVELRMAILRLERAGLVESDERLAIEVTDAGRVALEAQEVRDAGRA
jgi:hypothetical protein